MSLATKLQDLLGKICIEMSIPGVRTMKRLFVAAVFFAAAGSELAADARAQGVVTTYRSAYVGPAVGAYPAGYVPPYSYWAAPAPYPARMYVGPVGDFAYHGRPYGHAYDSWTWPYLSGPPYYGGSLNRYYYPPLGW